MTERVDHLRYEDIREFCLPYREQMREIVEAAPPIPPSAVDILLASGLLDFLPRTRKAAS